MLRKDKIWLQRLGKSAMAAAVAGVIALPSQAQTLRTLEDAGTIGKRLTLDGRLAVYGIFFETGSAALADDSKAVVTAIAQVLEENPEFAIAVIGHTDAVGEHEFNLDLSKQRANTLVTALENDHGIASERLFPAGAGFLRPIATNETKQGRALNRRVELIRMDLIFGETEKDPIAENAKAMVKAMSDYMAAQNAISFDYNSILEVVTVEQQKLGLASSGTVVLQRPDKIHMTRHGGFANVEVNFDGATLSLLGKNQNLYAQAAAPGTVDELVETLRLDHDRRLPAADLLMTDLYNQLIPQVIEVKDLGSGVINGVECDHLAFRTAEVDWQLWIAQGDAPFPCRYVIATSDVRGQPQYSVQLSNFTVGDAVETDGAFAFEPPAEARKIDFADLQNIDELPARFRPAN